MPGFSQQLSSVALCAWAVLFTGLSSACRTAFNQIESAQVRPLVSALCLQLFQQLFDDEVHRTGKLLVPICDHWHSFSPEAQADILTAVGHAAGAFLVLKQYGPGGLTATRPEMVNPTTTNALALMALDDPGAASKRLHALAASAHKEAHQAPGHPSGSRKRKHVQTYTPSSASGPAKAPKGPAPARTSLSQRQ